MTLMKRRTMLGGAMATFLMERAALAAEQKPLELFGVSIKGASRDQMRQAFKQGGLRSTREDRNYWIDTYDAQGVLDGASEFEAGYVSATDKFAYSQYTFPGFMDTELVGKIISMVASKYGRTTSQSGSYGLGPVIARWSLAQGMQIEVSRGWPNTTTYLKFIDLTANAQMQNEIEAMKKSQESKKNKAQSGAF